MSTQKFTILLILLLLTPIITNTSLATQSSFTLRTKLLTPNSSDNTNNIEKLPLLKTSLTTLDTKNNRIIIVGQNYDRFSEIWEFSLLDFTWNFLTYLSGERDLYTQDLFYNSLTNEIIIITSDIYYNFKTFILTEENEISRVDIFPFSLTKYIWTDYLFIEKFNVLFTFGGRDQTLYYNTTQILDFKISEWILIDTSHYPSNRVLHSMIYVPTSDQIVLFGGFGLSSDGDAFIGMNDTWVFDLITLSWTEIKVDLPPASRARSRMTYDTSSDRVLLFGGSDSENLLFYDDLWSFDASTYQWTLINNSLGVGERGLPGLDYIPSSNSIILTGGYFLDQSFHYYNDTWEISFVYPPENNIFGFDKMIIPIALFLIGMAIIAIFAIGIYKIDR